MAVLTERSDKAIAINCLGRKVLTFDVTNARRENYGDEDFITWYGQQSGSKAVVIKKNTRYGDMRYGCTLHRVTSNREIDQRKGCGDYFYLSLDMVGLTADDHYSDYLKFAETANAPVIEEGDKCSILVYNRRTGMTEVHTVIAEGVNAYYSPAAHFVEESEEETRKAIDREKRR